MPPSQVKKWPQSNLVLLSIFTSIIFMAGTFQYLQHNLKMVDNKGYLFILKGNDTLLIKHHPNYKKPKQAEVQAILKNKIDPDIILSPKSASDYYLQDNSPVFVALAVIAVFVGCAAGLVPFLYNIINELFSAFKYDRTVWIYTGLITAGLGLLILLTQVLPYYQQPINLMEDFKILLKYENIFGRPRMFSINAFVIFGIVVALTGVFGQLLINKSIGLLPDSILIFDKQEQKSVSKKFLLLRNSLNFFLYADATLVVFSVINTEALRGAIKNEVSANIELFPQNYVYLCGLCFTFFLAVVYIPIFQHLKDKGSHYLDQLTDESEPCDEKTINILTIEQTPLSSLKVALTILSPVLTSLVPGILKI